RQNRNEAARGWAGWLAGAAASPGLSPKTAALASSPALARASRRDSLCAFMTCLNNLNPHRWRERFAGRAKDLRLIPPSSILQATRWRLSRSLSRPAARTLLGGH